MSQANSTTYIKRPPNITPKEECILYTKEALGGRLFMGSYEERKYVPLLGEYRDVIVINNEETDLFRDIDKLRQKWRHIPGVKWLGITGPDDTSEQNNYCFWVKLTNIAFGNYWFQIKHIKLMEDELCLTIKYIRKTSSMYSYASTSSIRNEFPTSMEPSLTYDFLKTFFKSQALSIQSGIENAFAYIEPNITWPNFVKAIQIVFTAIVMGITGLFLALKYAFEYLLLLIRELSMLVHAFTPIVIHIIDFFSKIIGGLFILIAGILNKRYLNKFEPHPKETNLVYYAPNQRHPINNNWRERNRMLREELLGVQK